jgi:hypothetical protein
MPRLNLEALIFCLVWAALAVFAFVRAGYLAGAILSVGLLLLIMPMSSLILDKMGDLGTERLARWAVLILAAAGFAIYSIA